MQIVILAGGLGTRLGPLTKDLAKSMVRISGKPFLQYQIESLKNQGIEDVVLCVGYLQNQIRDYVGDGKQFGLRVQYSQDGEHLLGTWGAIKKAAPLLDNTFLVTNGDTYLPINCDDVVRRLERSDKLATMVVYENKNLYDISNIIIEGTLVRVYNKAGNGNEMRYIDAGLSAVKKEVLEFIPDGKAFSQNDICQSLIKRKQLAAYITEQRFYEIGSTRGLEEFCELVTTEELKQ